MVAVTDETSTSAQLLRVLLAPALKGAATSTDSRLEFAGRDGASALVVDLFKKANVRQGDTPVVAQGIALVYLIDI